MVTWLAEPQVGQPLIVPVNCDHPELVDQLVKSQSVRIFDVFLIGPLMIYGATKMPRGPAAVVLGLFGLGTIVFNGINYLRVRKTHEACASGGVV